MSNGTKRQFLTAEEEYMLIRMVNAKMTITKEKLKKKVKDERASLNASIYNITDNVRKKSFCSVFEESEGVQETPQKVDEISASCPTRRKSNRTSHKPWLLERPSSTESLGRERTNSGCSAVIR